LTITKHILILGAGFGGLASDFGMEISRRIGKIVRCEETAATPIVK
jgi:NADH dehydrogenase FAD-containing subunit